MDWDEIIPTEIRRKMGVCLEKEGLLSNVTAREGLELLFRFKYGDHNEKLREGSRKLVKQLAQRFGVEGVLDLRPHAMSSAERKLIGICRAFLSKPSVIVLENPSENVGNFNRQRLLSGLEEICSQPERTFLVSTDDWPLAWRFCPRWIVMKDGRIDYDGPAEGFMARPDDAMARQILDLIQRLRSSEGSSRETQK
jgi:ABC-type multidrug transport system ATPase subunit